MARSPLDPMDFELSTEQHQVKERAAKFARTAPSTLPVDGQGFAAAAHAGLGGTGLLGTEKTLEAALVAVELGRASASLGMVFSTVWRFLGRVRGHEDLSSLVVGGEGGGLTGAVAVGVTKGAPGVAFGASGDGFVLTGSTRFAPLLPVASHAVVSATTPDGVILACVELAATGVTKLASPPSLGLAELPRGALELSAVRVAKSSVLATGPDARAKIATLSDDDAILSAAVAVGIAGRALERAVAFVRGSGKPSQATEFVLSDLATVHDAALLSVMRAAWKRDQGGDTRAEAASAKLLSARAAADACHGVLRVSGERGYTEDLRQAYLDARHLELYDGSETDQIDAIASRVLEE